MKLRLFVFLTCAYLLLASREPPWGDAHVVYDTTQNLIERGHLDVTLGGPTQFYSIRDGKKYGVFPLGNVIAMIPSYLAYKVLMVLPHYHVVEDLVFRLTCHISTSLLGAGVCVLFFAMAVREGASEGAALLLSLMLGFGSIVLIYARAPFSEALQTLAFTLTVERTLALGDRLRLRGALGLGLACGLLFNTKLVYAIAIMVVPIYLVIRHHRRPRELIACLLAAALPLGLLAGVAIWHNHLKTGTLLDSGYRIPDGVFSGDAYAALYGFFLSTGKSIFLYSPPLVLGFLAFPNFVRTRRAHALFIIAITAVVTLGNAQFRYWHADYCWGPRLLVPLTPVWLLPAAGEGYLDELLAGGRRRARALCVGALLGLGMWVQLLGGAFYWDHYIRIAIAVKDQTGAAGWYGEDLHHCHFIPQFSPLVGHSWILRHNYRGDTNPLEDAPWRRVTSGKVNIYGEWNGVRFDWWVLDWRIVPQARRWYLGVLAVLISGFGVAGGGLLARRPRPRSRIFGVQS